MKPHLKLALCALLLLPCTKASAVNILLNPGFESPVQTTLGNNLFATLDDWTLTSGNATLGNNVIQTDGSAYTGGPDSSHSGTQYYDIGGGDGYVSQSVSLSSSSFVTFGAWFSRRTGNPVTDPDALGSVDIYDSSNTLVASSPLITILGGASEENWFESVGTTTLAAGNYVVRVNMGDYTNADTVQLDVNPVPEPTALSFAALAGLTMLRRRRR